VRRVIVSVYVTLDGVMEDPQNWLFPFWNDDVGKYAHEQLFAADALLVGRVTYDTFAEAWPSRSDPEGFADRMNSLPKYVASTTLERAEWNNAHLLGSDVAADVAKLKASEGGDILMYGSPTLMRSLMEHGLVDEYKLWVVPLVLGKGKRLFTGDNSETMKLTDSKVFDSGLVILTYEPASPRQT